MRAHTDAATRNDAYSAVVRTKIWRPTRSIGRISRRLGRFESGVRPQQLDDERGAHPRLRDRRPCGRAGDAPVEAVDEEQLEHDVQRRSRRRRSRTGGAGSRRRAGSPGRRARRARPAGRARRSGSRRARSRRSARARRARAAAARRPPRAPRAARPRSRARPRAPARRAAPRARAGPRPTARATTAVVPYVRKLKIVNAPASTVPASPSAASCGRPRWPTIAVSTST